MRHQPYLIETGVLPPPRVGPGFPSLFPLASLAIGQSFLIPASKTHACRVSAWAFSRHHPAFVFTVKARAMWRHAMWWTRCTRVEPAPTRTRREAAARRRRRH
jgi:hypothetical protein